MKQVKGLLDHVIDDKVQRAHDTNVSDPPPSAAGTASRLALGKLSELRGAWVDQHWVHAEARTALWQRWRCYWTRESTTSEALHIYAVYLGQVAAKNTPKHDDATETTQMHAKRTAGRMNSTQTQLCRLPSVGPFLMRP